MAQTENDAVSQPQLSVDDLFTESIQSVASSEGSSHVGLSSQSEDTVVYFSGVDNDEAEAEHRVTSPAVSMPESSAIHQAGAAAQSLLSDSNDSGFQDDAGGEGGGEMRDRARSLMEPVIRLLAKGRRMMYLATRGST